MKTIVISVVLAACLAQAQSPKSNNVLVGTWKLISVSSWKDHGEINKKAHGANPTGFLTYTSDGRVSVVIAEDGRRPLSVADRVSAPVQERADAFSTFIAYAGRYTFTGDKVVHHVEVASMPNDVNTDYVRSVKLQGDRLTLRTPPMSRGGVLQNFELVWERVK